MARIKKFYIQSTSAAVQPAYFAQIKYASDETAVDLTSASLTFTMIDSINRTRKIDASATGCSLVDAANGKVKYDWQAGDLDTPGYYVVYFNVTPASGNPFTFPTGGPEYKGGTIAEVIITNDYS